MQAMSLKLLLVAVVVFSMQLAAQDAPGHDRNALSILDAVESAVRNHPLLKAQEAQVMISRGLREQAAGPFDAITQGSVNQQRIETPLSTAQKIENATFGVSGSIEHANQTGVLFGVTKLFRSGTSVSASFQAARNDDNLLSSPGINTSTTALTVVVPLLRGRGRKVAAAQEDAAATEVSATLFDLNQLTAQVVNNVAISYWNLVATKKLLNIAEQAENRGQSYFSTVQSLIDADHVPRNDLNEVKANLAQRASARINAEQQVVAAEQQLALDMGLSPSEMLARAASPSDDLPVPDERTLPDIDQESLRYYLGQALGQRADYQGAQRRMREAGILAVAARNRLLPQIDLSSGTSYAAVRTGLGAFDFLGAPGSAVAGPSASATISYTFFGGNHAARGALGQAEASRQQAALQVDQLARNITANLVTAVAAVRNAILRAQKARLAVESFEQALSGEREKYRVGLGSVVDILTLEDRLNSAQTDQIQAELAYAIALIQFRFATGTLFEQGESGQIFHANLFVTLPFTEPRQP